VAHALGSCGRWTGRHGVESEAGVNRGAGAWGGGGAVPPPAPVGRPQQWSASWHPLPSFFPPFPPFLTSSDDHAEDLSVDGHLCQLATAGARPRARVGRALALLAALVGAARVHPRLQQPASVCACVWCVCACM
jgi:hypothetical protein